MTAEWVGQNLEQCGKRHPSWALLASLCLFTPACSSIQGARGEYVDFIRPDLRPPLVEARRGADSLWGPASESTRGDGIAESRRGNLEELVRRFTPTLVLPRGDYTRPNDKKIRLLPTNVDLFTDTMLIDLVSTSPYGFTDSQTIVLDDLPDDSLIRLAAKAEYQSDPNILEVWYFDFPGDRPREWWAEYAAFRSGPDSTRWANPTVYAHPFIDSSDRLVIQYWHFYPFNDFMGNHEGDWERINVVVSEDRQSIDYIHYYFHARSIILPDTLSGFVPEIVDGTHPVIYAGGRMYNIFDYPTRWLEGDRNEGSHAYFPYPGEWEAAAGLGAPESVPKVGNDSGRVIHHHAFDVRLMPEPTRFEFSEDATALRDWGWLLFPVRFGFPAAPSMGSGFGSLDVGNRSWFGPAYHPGWNRTAPGLLYSAYRPKKLSTIQSFIEDLLQPWYYLYIFRTPRYIHEIRGSGERDQLERLGLAPRGGWGERGFGTTLLGVQLLYPQDQLGDVYGTSVGISFWRNLWAKMRFGAVEFLGGYQKLRQDDQSVLFVYPFTASFVVRAPDRKFRPYVGGGAGIYGWESRIQNADGTRTLDNGWGPGWTATIGLEYYMRTKVAFDLGVHYHNTSASGGLPGDPGMKFFTVWIGHYVRF